MLTKKGQCFLVVSTFYGVKNLCMQLYCHAWQTFFKIREQSDTSYLQQNHTIIFV